MQPYHYVWLSAHPNRTEEWLKEKLAEGFDVHHADLNHNNNDPDNLILVEHRDHMLLHHGKRFFVRNCGTKLGTTRKKKEKPLYNRPIGPMWHWRFKGIPIPYTIEYQMRRYPHRMLAA